MSQSCSAKHLQSLGARNMDFESPKSLHYKSVIQKDVKGVFDIFKSSNGKFLIHKSKLDGTWKNENNGIPLKTDRYGNIPSYLGQETHYLSCFSEKEQLDIEEKFGIL